jgi:hypothetical protein
MGYRPSCNPIVQHIFSYPANQNNSLSHHQTVRQPIAVEIRQYAINNNWLSYFLWKKFRIPLVPLFHQQCDRWLAEDIQPENKVMVMDTLEMLFEMDIMTKTVLAQLKLFVGT